jgi:glycosyltransferase involved in cell wall biosynthesis
MTRFPLSIAVPTRNRPQLLQRALDSVVRATDPIAEAVEVAISDGSDDDTSEQVIQRFVVGWPGGHQYVRNQPPLGQPENMNRAVELATGEWILQLHDDDYLLPGAGRVILEAARRVKPAERVLLFGVEVVDIHGARRKAQTFRREQYLEPRVALRPLLSNSSFVRIPAAVVHRSAFEEEGLFDTTMDGPCDTEMWVRLFSRYGVRCVPHTTCAYTVHQTAATTGQWQPATIQLLCEIFDRAVARGVVPERRIRRWQADWFHQFILAGAYRRLRIRQRVEARNVLRLFDLPEVRALGASPKWLPVRVAFTAATASAPRRR